MAKEEKYETDLRAGRPNYTKENVDTLSDVKFLRLYDLKYAEGKHYYDASRRPLEDLVALKPDEEFRSMIPDAVTIAVVLLSPGGPPRLLMSYEYRYPVGQYLLGPVAGLIDPEDRSKEDPLKEAAVREIKEEVGLTVKDTDRITVINPCAFSSPGMSDESNAFLCAEIHIDDTVDICQDGAVGSELFSGYELIDYEEAERLFSSGRDRYGNFFSLATWVVIGFFLKQFGNKQDS
ncbi:MAG: NUDIX hydrolase [Lachnospiraceae bacterium]|nr:NUDIX hydrolase [Lachnospiraceae bacterium]